MSASDDAERRARIWLSGVFEPGDPVAAKLLAQFPATAVLERILTAAPNEQSRFADWSGRARQIDDERLLAAAATVSARFVGPDDPEWPLGLADLDTHGGGDGTARWSPAPLGLWLRGEAQLAGVVENAVAIVGSRAATAYGQQVARDVAFGCSGRGCAVVSGGAYGIDAAAHEGALVRERPTVAVLAGGIDRLYPAGNSGLLREIAASGLLVSEAPPGAAPTKSRFLVRNRLIAAFSSGTVVVEAALRSGSLSTARWARDLGRSVMGVPGPVTSMASAGVHELLREPESVLVTDAADVIAQLAPLSTEVSGRKVGPDRAEDTLSPQARRVLDGVPSGWAVPVDTVAREAGVRASTASHELRELERRGLVTRCGRGWALASPTGSKRG
jgi:DNA processing protein